MKLTKSDLAAITHTISGQEVYHLRFTLEGDSHPIVGELGDLENWSYSGHHTHRTWSDEGYYFDKDTPDGLDLDLTQLKQS